MPKRAKPSASVPRNLRVPAALRWLPPVLLIAAVLWAFRAALWGAVIHYRDMNTIFTGMRLLVMRAARAGIFPMWNPYVSCGSDMITNLRAALFYPVQWLFVLFAGWHVNSWMAIAHILLGALSLYAIARRFALDPVIALVVALGFAFGHMTLAPLEFTMDVTFVWTPVNALLFILFCQERRLRYLALLGLTSAMQIVTPEQRVFMHGYMLLGFLWLGELVRVRWIDRAPLRQQFLSLVSLPLTGLFMLLLAAPWALPFRAGLKSAVFREGVDFKFFAEGSIPPSAFIAYLMPYWNGLPIRGMWWNAHTYPEYWIQPLYCGIFVWLCAPLTLVTAWRRTSAAWLHVVTLWCFFIFAVVYALGRHAFLAKLIFDWFPFMRGARWPGLMSHTANVALLLLAGFGLRDVFAWARARDMRHFRLWLGWAAVCLFVLLVYWGRSADRTFIAEYFGLGAPLAPQAATWISTHLGQQAKAAMLALLAASACVCAACWIRASLAARIAPWALAAVAAVELIYFAQPLIAVVDKRVMTEPPAAALRVRSDPDFPQFRITEGNNLTIMNLFLYGERNWRKFMWYKNASICGNIPAAVEVYSSLLCDRPIYQPWFEQIYNQLRISTNAVAFQRFLGTKEYWYATSYDMPEYHAENPFGGLAVRIDTNWLPRITFPANVIPVASDAEASAVLTNAAFVFGRDAVVHTNTLAALPPSGGAQAATLHFHEDYNYLVATVSVARAGLAVVNSSYHPDWRCYIDGRRVPALRVNYAFRGCSVTEGTHEIRFVYTPRLMYIGAAVSGATLLVLIVLCVGEELLRRRAPAPPRH